MANDESADRKHRIDVPGFKQLRSSDSYLESVAAASEAKPQQQAINERVTEMRDNETTSCTSQTAAKAQLEQLIHCVVESGESKMRRRASVVAPVSSKTSVTQHQDFSPSHDSELQRRRLQDAGAASEVKVDSEMQRVGHEPCSGSEWAARRASAAKWYKSAAFSTLAHDNDEYVVDDDGAPRQDPAATTSILSPRSGGPKKSAAIKLETNMLAHKEDDQHRRGSCGSMSNKSGNKNYERGEMNWASRNGAAAQRRNSGLGGGTTGRMSDCKGRKSGDLNALAATENSCSSGARSNSSETNMTNRRAAQWQRADCGDCASAQNPLVISSKFHASCAHNVDRDNKQESELDGDEDGASLEELDEREESGPTPTNDLVRALLQRDRCAWAGPTRASQIRGNRDECSSGQAGRTIGSQHSQANDCCCKARNTVRDRNLKPEVVVVDFNDNERNIGDSSFNDQTRSVAAKSERRQASQVADNGKSVEHRKDDDAACQQLDQLTIDASEPSAGNGGVSTAGAARKQQQRQSLSPYRLAVRAIETMRLAVDEQQECHKRGSNAPNLISSESNFGDAACQSRRHSTYMLPQLLRERAAESTSESDDEDIADLVGDSPPLSSESCANDEHRAWAATAGALPTSASSPSALSTPTNDYTPSALQTPDNTYMQSSGQYSSQQQQQDIASARSEHTATTSDCGGARCAARVQLLKLATENALFSAGCGRLATTSVRSNDDRASLTNLGARVAGQRRELSAKASWGRRIGSNPLVRFRRASGQTLTMATGTIKHHTGSEARLSQKSTMSKRYSIINLLSGVHAVCTHKVTPDRDIRTTEGTALQQAFSSASNNLQHEHEQQQQYDQLIPESGFKIVVMGTSGSGKTAIIQRFLYGTFSKRHQPTVEDTYFIEFPYRKNMINISVSDTSGTYQFPAMKKLAINSGDAFILVYSVDDPQSFEDLKRLREQILCEREQAYLEATNSSASIISNDSAAVVSTLSVHNNSLCAPTVLQSSSTSAEYCATNQQTSLHVGSCAQGGLSLSTANQQQSSADLSPSRHWSLASLFNHYNSQSQLRHGISCKAPPGLSQHPMANTLSVLTSQQPNGQHNDNSCSGHSSLGSSICSSIGSNTSSADNSRRSSISAAEAALKIRRTKKPPMVIVANKHDLPKDRHFVNSNEVEVLAVIDWDNGFVKSSAAFNWNIDEIFQQVLRQAKQPPTLTEAIVSKRRKSLPPKLPQYL